MASPPLVSDPCFSFMVKIELNFFLKLRSFVCYDVIMNKRNFFRFANYTFYYFLSLP